MRSSQSLPVLKRPIKNRPRYEQPKEIRARHLKHLGSRSLNVSPERKGLHNKRNIMTHLSNK